MIFQSTQAPDIRGRIIYRLVLFNSLSVGSDSLKKIRYSFCYIQKKTVWMFLLFGGRFLSGIRPPADSKGPPFVTFSEIHFLPIDPKVFLMAPWARIYTNFERERALKKT